MVENNCLKKLFRLYLVKFIQLEEFIFEGEGGGVSLGNQLPKTWHDNRNIDYHL